MRQIFQQCRRIQQRGFQYQRNLRALADLHFCPALEVALIDDRRQIAQGKRLCRPAEMSAEIKGTQFGEGRADEGTDLGQFLSS